MLSKPKEVLGYVAAGTAGVLLGGYIGAELGMLVDVHHLAPLPLFPLGIGETFGATLIGMTGGVGGLIGFANLIGDTPSKNI